MFKITMMLNKVLHFLGADPDKGYTGGDDNLIEVANKIRQIIVDFMPAVLIGLGVVCAIYAIVLGIQYAQSEGDEKRAEVKKKLINGVIGIVIAIILLLVMFIIANNAGVIAKWIKDGSGK